MLDGAENGTSPFPPDAPLRGSPRSTRRTAREGRMLAGGDRAHRLLDHALLAHDLPSLADGQFAAAGHGSARAREAWLLDQAALISTAQAKQSRANTPIATSDAPPGMAPATRYGPGRHRRSDGGGRRGGGGPPSCCSISRAPAAAPARCPSCASCVPALLAARSLARAALRAADRRIFRRAAPDRMDAARLCRRRSRLRCAHPSRRAAAAALLVRRAHRRSLDGGLALAGVGRRAAAAGDRARCCAPTG